jgi:hypothetical protein
MTALLVFGVSACGGTEEAEEPYTVYDAEDWYREVYISTNPMTCPEPFNVETECEFSELLGAQAVDLPAGTRLPDNYAESVVFRYSEPPEPPAVVVLNVPQTVWCFGVKRTTRYDYLEKSDYTTPNGHVEYLYPCYSLGPNPNNLGAHVGELQLDGTISLAAYEHCSRVFWSDTRDRLECTHAIQDVPLSERSSLPAP